MKYNGLQELFDGFEPEEKHALYEVANKWFQSNISEVKKLVIPEEVLKIKDVKKRIAAIKEFVEEQDLYCSNETAKNLDKKKKQEVCTPKLPS